MSAVEVIARLQQEGLRIFSTLDVRLLAGLSPGAASHLLRRMESAGLLLFFKRGLWAFKQAPGLRLAEAVPHYTHPWPSYISLHSALSEAGTIAEIPHTLSAVSAGPGFFRRSPLGDLKVYRLPQNMIWGFQRVQRGACVYFLADPEKALLDLAYLSQVPRSGLRWPAFRPGRTKLDVNKLRAYAKKMANARVVSRLREEKLL